jgi:hypothetical protein
VQPPKNSLQSFIQPCFFAVFRRKAGFRLKKRKTAKKQGIFICDCWGLCPQTPKVFKGKKESILRE